MGLDKLNAFWDAQDWENNPKLKGSPVRHRKGLRDKGIPIQLHGDGASFEDRDSLVTTSFYSALRDGTLADNSYNLASWPKGCAVKTAGGTWDTIWA